MEKAHTVVISTFHPHEIIITKDVAEFNCGRWVVHVTLLTNQRWGGPMGECSDGAAHCAGDN